MATVSAPLNAREAMVDEKRRPSKSFLEWVTSSVLTRLDSAPARASTASVTERAASIGTTSLNSGSLSAGLYQVSWFARITQAATVSSSLTVTISFTQGGVSLTLSGVALTGNTTTTVQAESPHLIRIDGATPVSYSTTYVSVGATAMKYRLDVVLTRVDA